MRLGYAFLANAGEFTPDGKLNVLGGDLDTLAGTGFPLTHPYMVLIIKLLLDSDDMGREHALRVETLTPSGDLIRDPLEIPIIAPTDAPRPGHPPALAFVMQMANLVFGEPGKYVWRVYADGSELASLQLHVIPQQAV